MNQNMMDNLKMMKEMGMVFLQALMDQNMRENLKIIKNKERAFSYVLV
jgi:hypothetical protein